ncbi:MAG: hypothetical protein V4850_02790 [Myxococcota bacterium]
MSLGTALLAFSVSANLGLFSVEQGIIASAYTGSDTRNTSIVFDAGDGVVTIGGAGELFCDKVNGCVRRDAELPLPAGLTGSGVVLFGGQDLELGGQDLELGGQELEFSDVTGMGMEDVVDAVRASLDGEAFDLFGGVTTGVVCGDVDENAAHEVLSPRDSVHSVKSPRDSASGLPTGLRMSTAGDSAGALPFAYKVDMHTIGSDEGSSSADTFAMCAVFEDSELVSYAVLALRNGDSLSDRPNRVTGVVTSKVVD